MADPPDTEGLGRGDLPEALHRVGALSKRRGFVCVISDFAGEEWSPPMSALAMRHDLLAIGIVDPREFDVPPIGLVTFSDPDRAAENQVKREQTMRASGSDWLELSTDRDWLTEIAAHVRRRRLRPAMVHR